MIFFVSLYTNCSINFVPRLNFIIHSVDNLFISISALVFKEFDTIYGTSPYERAISVERTGFD